MKMWEKTPRARRLFAGRLARFVSIERTSQIIRVMDSMKKIEQVKVLAL